MDKMRTLLTTHADKNTKLTVRKISVDRNDDAEFDPAMIHDYVLVEGDRDSLRFLGELLIAFVESEDGCSFDLHPQGPGCAHFNNASDLGISLHKLPSEFKSKVLNH